MQPSIELKLWNLLPNYFHKTKNRHYVSVRYMEEDGKYTNRRTKIHDLVLEESYFHKKSTICHLICWTKRKRITLLEQNCVAVKVSGD